MSNTEQTTRLHQAIMRQLKDQYPEVTATKPEVAFKCNRNIITDFYYKGRFNVDEWCDFFEDNEELPTRRQDLKAKGITAVCRYANAPESGATIWRNHYINDKEQVVFEEEC